MRVIDHELVGQGQGVKKAKTTANCGLAIMEGIPSETDPWFEVLGSGVPRKELVVECAEGWIGTKGRKVLDQTMGLRRNGFEFVPQAQIQS